MLDNLFDDGLCLKRRSSRDEEEQRASQRVNVGAFIGPLRVFGLNPLFAYVLSIFWVKILLRWVHLPAGGETLNGYAWLYQQVFVPIAGPMNGSLLFAIAHVVFFWSILLILYRKRIIIKI